LIRSEKRVIRRNIYRKNKINYKTDISKIKFKTKFVYFFNRNKENFENYIIKLKLYGTILTLLKTKTPERKIIDLQ